MTAGPREVMSPEAKEEVDAVACQRDSTIEVPDSGLLLGFLGVDGSYRSRRVAVLQPGVAILREQLEAGFSLRTGLIDEDETAIQAGGVACEVVTATLGSLQRFGGVRKSVRSASKAPL